MEILVQWLLSLLDAARGRSDLRITQNVVRDEVVVAGGPHQLRRGCNACKGGVSVFPLFPHLQELDDSHCPLRLLSASLGSSVRLRHYQRPGQVYFFVGSAIF